MDRDYITVNRQTYDAAAEEFRNKIPIRAAADRDIAAFFDFYAMAEIEKSCPTLLELGPGSGNMLKLLDGMGYMTFAVEFSRRMADVARYASPNTRFYIENFLEHTSRRKYDSIVANAFIHLFPKEDSLKVLEKIYRLLDVPGVALISTTEHSASCEGYTPKVNFTGSPVRFRKMWTESELEHALRQTGFSILDLRKVKDKEVRSRIWMNFVVKKG